MKSVNSSNNFFNNQNELLHYIYDFEFKKIHQNKIRSNEYINYFLKKNNQQVNISNYIKIRELNYLNNKNYIKFLKKLLCNVKSISLKKTFLSKTIKIELVIINGIPLTDSLLEKTKIDPNAIKSLNILIVQSITERCFF